MSNHELPEKKNSNRISRIFNSLKQSKNKSVQNRPNGDQYYYIHEFEQADEKTCIRFDKKNEEIYQKNLKLFNDINKKLINTPFNINNKPEPPKRPSNYERLHLWKKRNIKISAHNQTLAILYLMANNMNIKLDEYSNGVEPFEAVNFAEKISMDKNENIINVVKNFLPYLQLNNDTFNKYKESDKMYNIEYTISEQKSLKKIISSENIYGFPNNKVINDSNNYTYNIRNSIRSNIYPELPNNPYIQPPSAPPPILSDVNNSNNHNSNNRTRFSFSEQSIINSNSNFNSNSNSNSNSISQSFNNNDTNDSNLIPPSYNTDPNPPK